MSVLNARKNAKKGALSIALGSLIAFAPTANTASIADTSQPAQTQVATPKLTVSLQNPIVQANDTEITVFAELKNDSTGNLPAGSISIHINPEKIKNEAELDTNFPSNTKEISNTSISPINNGSSRTVRITIPVSSLGLQSDNSGVFMLQAQYIPTNKEKTVTQTSTTPLIWNKSAENKPTNNRPAENKLPLSVIVPLLLPSEIETMPTKDEIIRLTASGGAWQKLVNTTRNANATLAIDPRIIVAIKGLGDDAPPATKDFLASLEATDTSKFLLQYADADIAAQAELGLQTPLQPSGLSFASEYQSEIPTPSLSSTGGVSATTADSSSGKSDTPLQFGADIKTLSNFPETIAPTVWPVQNQVTHKTLDFAGHNGFKQIIVDSNNITRSDSAVVSVGDENVIVSSHKIADYLTQAAQTNSDTVKAQALAYAYSITALAQDNKQTGIAVALDRENAANDPAKTADLLGSLTKLSWLAPTFVSAQKSGSAQLQTTSLENDRLAQLKNALQPNETMNALSGYLENPQFFNDFQQLRLLHLFSAENAGDNFVEAHKKYAEQQAKFAKGVTFIAPNHVRMVGESSHIPLQITNSLPFNARVNTRFKVANSSVSVKNPLQDGVQVHAGRTATVYIDVDSRVTNGSTPVILEIIDPKTGNVVNTEVLHIDISSAVEKIVIVVFFSAIVLFIGFGVARSRRSHKRKITKN